MNTQDTIRARRAIKHFDPNFVIPVQDEQELKDLLRQSPTSFNIQNWRFVIVKDTALREQIQEAAWNQKQVTSASLLFILCADIKAWEKSPERYWTDAPREAQDILIPMIKPFYDGKEELQRDEAMRSVGIAAQTLMLGAKALGYDTCPMIGYDAEKVAELINLPKDHAVGMIVTVGKASQNPWPKPGFLPDEDVFIEDRF